MREIIFQLIQYLLMAFGVALMGVVIPSVLKWGKAAESTLRKNNQLLAANIVEMAVHAMEQVVNGEGKGAIKYENALTLIKAALKQNNIELSDKEISTMIESVVYGMNNLPVTGVIVSDAEISGDTDMPKYLGDRESIEESSENEGDE